RLPGRGWTGAGAAVRGRVRRRGAVPARRALARPLPLRAGDRGLLRDPGRHRIVAGVRVLDVAPPPLSRRGAAARRGAELTAAVDDQALALLVLRHRGFATAAELSRLGLPAAGLPVGGAWLADESRWTALKAGAGQAYEAWHHRPPLAAGMPTDALRRPLDLPDAGLVEPIAAAAGLRIENGHVRRPEPAALPPAVDHAVRALERDLA